MPYVKRTGCSSFLSLGRHNTLHDAGYADFASFFKDYLKEHKSVLSQALEKPTILAIDPEELFVDLSKRSLAVCLKEKKPATPEDIEHVALDSGSLFVDVRLGAYVSDDAPNYTFTDKGCVLLDFMMRASARIADLVASGIYIHALGKSFYDFKDKPSRVVRFEECSQKPLTHLLLADISDAMRLWVTNEPTHSNTVRINTLVAKIASSPYLPEEVRSSVRYWLKDKRANRDFSLTNYFHHCWDNQYGEVDLLTTLVKQINEIAQYDI